MNAVTDTGKATAGVSAVMKGTVMGVEGMGVDESKKTRIAVAYWEARVSPLFDTTQKILVVDFMGRERIFQRIIEIDECGSRVSLLCGLKVDVLICGGISRIYFYQLASASIEVVSWVAGEIEEVLSAYSDDCLEQGRFIMPGCRGRCLRCRFRNRKKVRR